MTDKEYDDLEQMYNRGLECRSLLDAEIVKLQARIKELEIAIIDEQDTSRAYREKLTRYYLHMIQVDPDWMIKVEECVGNESNGDGLEDKETGSRVCPRD